MEHNPKSTSTGIFNPTLSISTVIGPVIAGTIAFAYGYVSVMYFAVAVVIVAFVITISKFHIRLKFHKIPNILANLINDINLFIS